MARTPETLPSVSTTTRTTTEPFVRPLKSKTGNCGKLQRTARAFNAAGESGTTRLGLLLPDTPVEHAHASSNAAGIAVRLIFIAEYTFERREAALVEFGDGRVLRFVQWLGLGRCEPERRACVQGNAFAAREIQSC